MRIGNDDIPESWLIALGGRDISGWLLAFTDSPKKAVADLLWDSFYFGPLNPNERGQLLETWLDLLGNSEQFAERLDAEFTSWVDENWGRFEHSAHLLASAWLCLLSVVEFSSKLQRDSVLGNCADALRIRFAERQRFLGSFSTAPAADPLGLYLAVVAEFQGNDRSLAAFWHRMCDLREGVPFYHARYAMLGLRRLKALDPIEDGTLRAEIVLGLFRLARAFDRLVREHTLPEHIAKMWFSRVAAQTVAAYPNSPRWGEHGATKVLDLPDRPRIWLQEAIPTLVDAMQRPSNRRPPRQHSTGTPVQPNRSWAKKARELAACLRVGNSKCLAEIGRLLNEQRHYAGLTGETYYLARTLDNFAVNICSIDPDLALCWAQEAWKLEPESEYTWNIISKILLIKHEAAAALRFAWVAWKRFPGNVFARNGLAEVLKHEHRYREAEQVFRQTIERFPLDAAARNGLAEVLKHDHRYKKAEEVYRRTIERFPGDVRASNGLADTLRRKGDLDAAEQQYRDAIRSGLIDKVTFIGLAYLVLRKGKEYWTEALGLADRALRLDPHHSYALFLKQNIQSDDQESIYEAVRKWNESIDVLDKLTPASSGDYEWEAEKFTTISNEPGEGPSPDRHDALLKAAPATCFMEGIEPRRVSIFDYLQIPALVAEAYFYRMWALVSEDEPALEQRKRAAELLSQAGQIVPQDSQVLAEQAALLVDEGNEPDAYQTIMNRLGSHLSAVPLLVLKSRIDRARARRESRRLDKKTLDDLYSIPQHLRDLDSNLAPLSHFQKGLAVLSLFDGEMRKVAAADEFSRFRRTLEHRAAAETEERETYRNPNAREMPGFYEWLKTQVNGRIFAGLARPDESNVGLDDIIILEEAWENHPRTFEEVEDLLTDRAAYRNI